MKIRDKVLIVEDEQNIKNFMSTILAANGFDTPGGQREGGAVDDLVALSRPDHP